VPPRVRKPRDKAKVEVAVLAAERWILARLERPRFFSLAELNQGNRRARRRPSPAWRICRCRVVALNRRIKAEAIPCERCKASACTAFCF
jgi:hypothetical protein